MHEEWLIQKVLNRYSESASRADWDTVLSLYLPDAIWEVPLLKEKFVGHDRIRAGLVQFSRPMAYIVQSNSPALIRVDGNTASSRSVFRESGKYSDRDEGIEILGAYDDRLTLTPDGWKFVLRTCIVHGMHDFPLSPRRQ